MVSLVRGKYNITQMSAKEQMHKNTRAAIIEFTKIRVDNYSKDKLSNYAV
jgi:hypothetical protein